MEDKEFSRPSQGCYYYISMFRLALRFGVLDEMAKTYDNNRGILDSVTQKKVEKVLKRACQRYYYASEKKMKEVKRPLHYMMVHEGNESMIEREYLTDVDLIIAILGRISGGLYIPNRDFRLENADLTKDIAFLKEDFDGE